jgi:hypothetical protein
MDCRTARCHDEPAANENFPIPDPGFPTWLFAKRITPNDEIRDRGLSKLPGLISADRAVTSGSLEA